MEIVDEELKGFKKYPLSEKENDLSTLMRVLLSSLCFLVNFL
jgi:hypothetical protein